MYHYVRNSADTAYKGIHAVKEKDFIQQVKHLQSTCEMASTEMIADFFKGQYVPKKDLCVLTFDDGLKEHANFVTEVLFKNKIQGQFFIPTACIEEGYVLPVHKNHFLLAYLPFIDYKLKVLNQLKEVAPETNLVIDAQKVAATYRWDTPEVGAFKYLLNYQLPKPLRNSILKTVFEDTFGPEKTFAKSLYINWEDAKSMQSKGMILGGHSHRHNVLSSLSDQDQEEEITTCMDLLRGNTNVQSYWPFSYPFGKSNTFNGKTKELLQQQQIEFAFTTVIGNSTSEEAPYHLKRIDPKDI